MNYPAGDRLQIGEFAELVGLSVPQLRRYDRLRLLEPAARSANSGYRYYSSGQTGAARVIALLRSMDMPIADIRLILTGVSEDDRRQIFRDHQARLEARLEEVRQLLEAVDDLSEEGPVGATDTRISGWLHLMPRIPVTDLDRSIGCYQEALGFRLGWRTSTGDLAAMSTHNGIDVLLLVPWTGDGSPPAQSAYVYVDDPDALCAEYMQSGADIVDPVASRPSGMRDFVVRDPDGHQFTLGRGEERLREVAERYGMTAEEISVNPDWLERRKREQG